MLFNEIERIIFLEWGTCYGSLLAGALTGYVALLITGYLAG